MARTSSGYRRHNPYANVRVNALPGMPGIDSRPTMLDVDKANQWLRREIRKVCLVVLVCVCFGLYVYTQGYRDFHSLRSEFHRTRLGTVIFMGVCLFFSLHECISA